MRTIECGLVICLALSLFVLTPGCRPASPPAQTSPQPTPEPSWKIAERLNPSAEGLTLPEHALPFVAVPPETTGGAAFLGYWDLAAGTVTFDPAPLFRTTYAQGWTGVVWDGGHRIGVMTDPPGIVPGNPNPAFAFDVLVPRAFPSLDIVACPSETGQLVVLKEGLLSPEGIGQLQVLYSEGADAGPQVYPFEVSGAPAALAILPDHIEAVVFSWDGQGGENGRFHLYRLEDCSVTAGPVSPALSVSMAGAGARFGRAGSRVYVADPGAGVDYWDIGTGEVAKDEVLTSHLKAYEAEYVPEHEYSVPPVLHGFRGTLVVVYRPAAVISHYDASGNLSNLEWIQTMYAVAMCDGQVVGEVICHRGKMIVKKDGVVTQEADLSAEYTGEWQFADVEG